MCPGIECNRDLSPVTNLGVQLSFDSLLDNPSGSAHCAEVRRNPLTRVIRRKPILFGQALPLFGAVREHARAQSSWT